MNTKATPPRASGDASPASGPVRRALADCRWEGVDLMRYKDDGSAPFRDVTRQVLFQLPELHCEWRYFEVAPAATPPSSATSMRTR